MKTHAKAIMISIIIAGLLFIVVQRGPVAEVIVAAGLFGVLYLGCYTLVKMSEEK